MKKGVIVMVCPTKLKQNRAASKLYSIPVNYETIRDNIEKVGILEPLIVVGDVVVSGNLRLRIAKELNVAEVPVIYTIKSKLSAELLAVSHGQQRVKKYSELLAEVEIIEATYPVGKGSRTDIDPIKKKNKDMQRSINLSKAKIVMLKSIKQKGIGLYNIGTPEYKKLWEDVDAEKSSLNRILKRLKSELCEKENNVVIPSRFELITELAKIYNKSCQFMYEIVDKSIACIICSPPYFQMRNYGTGEDQRGLEQDIDTYINGLIQDFNDCKRVLKDDGSLWVNINEPIVEKQYCAISHRFVIAMKEIGWIFNDEWLWIKPNPQFTQAKRSVRSHEYIFHFVKSKEFYYDKSWLTNLSDGQNAISIGTSGKIANLISGMDFRDNILKLNGNNMAALRKECKNNGFNLTHSAGYPLTLPLISILTTSKPGDTVLDIYSGTATTGEAALLAERNYIGYELKPEYIMGSEVRLRDYLREDILEAA